MPTEKYELPKFYFDKDIPLISFLTTYQGEGPNTGKKMVLCRFKYCNKSCPFCDTQGMMSKAPISFVSLLDIQKKLNESRNLMITGGEPTINKIIGNTVRSQYDNTLNMIKYLNYDFADIESNGSNITSLLDTIKTDLCLNERNISISWSPKFVSKDDYQTNIRTLKCIFDYKLYDHCVIKLVIGKELSDYRRFAYDAIYNIGFNPNKVYLMPLGTTSKEIANSFKEVLNVSKDLNCNISTRLHIMYNFE